MWVVKAIWPELADLRMSCSMDMGLSGLELGVSASGYPFDVGELISDEESCGKSCDDEPIQV
jgi:hypothetical protein